MISSRSTPSETNLGAASSAGGNRQGQASSAMGNPGLFRRLDRLWPGSTQPPAPHPPSATLDAQFGLSEPG